MDLQAHAALIERLQQIRGELLLDAPGADTVEALELLADDLARVARDGRPLHALYTRWSVPERLEREYLTGAPRDARGQIDDRAVELDREAYRREYVEPAREIGALLRQVTDAVYRSASGRFDRAAWRRDKGLPVRPFGERAAPVVAELAARLLALPSPDGTTTAGAWLKSGVLPAGDLKRAKAGKVFTEELVWGAEPITEHLLSGELLLPEGEDIETSYDPAKGFTIECTHGQGAYTVPAVYFTGIADQAAAALKPIPAPALPRDKGQAHKDADRVTGPLAEAARRSVVAFIKRGHDAGALQLDAREYGQFREVKARIDLLETKRPIADRARAEAGELQQLIKQLWRTDDNRAELAARLVKLDADQARKDAEAEAAEAELPRLREELPTRFGRLNEAYRAYHLPEGGNFLADLYETPGIFKLVADPEYTNTLRLLAGEFKTPKKPKRK